MKDVKYLMKEINYSFLNLSNLKEALTHSSYSEGSNNKNYERLEFLGDRVLGLIIANELFLNNKNSSEGELAKKLSFLVCKSTLKKIASEIEIEKYLKYSSRIKSLDGIKANALEALIGAIYLDSNFEDTKTIILKLWKKY